jgi:hypothetical protein
MLRDRIAIVDRSRTFWMSCGPAQSPRATNLAEAIDDSLDRLKSTGHTHKPGERLSPKNARRIVKQVMEGGLVHLIPPISADVD